MDLNIIAKLYNKKDFSVIEKINRWNTNDDKRFVFLIKFVDNQELAIKVCRNDFTTHERVLGWKQLCKTYLDLGIYCPQIIDSINGNASENIIINDEEFIVYAEEMKKFKTYEELNSKSDFELIKPDIIESIGKVAANCTYLLPFPSAFCIYDTFDSTEMIDENYQNAENFCIIVTKYFPEYSEYGNKIWELFLYKRKLFEPVHHLLPKASFQSDVNPSNILVDNNLKFAGYIDFNLSGTETVLSYIIINDICGYRLKESDLDHLNDVDFLTKCDDYLYQNLKIIGRNYTFSDYEKENICLCYNTVYPFSCWTINGMLSIVIKENKPEYIKSLLDWTYYQLSRDDIFILQ